MQIMSKEFWLKPMPEFLYKPRLKGRGNFNHTNRHRVNNLMFYESIILVSLHVSDIFTKHFYRS